MKLTYSRIAALTLALTTAAACGSKYEGRASCRPEQNGQRMCVERGMYDLLKCEDGFWMPNTESATYNSRFKRLKDCQIICSAYQKSVDQKECLTPEPTPMPIATSPLSNFEQENITVNPDGTVDVDMGTIDFSKIQEKK